MTEDLSPLEQQALAKLIRIEEKWPLMKWLLIILAAFNFFTAYRSFMRADEAWGLLSGIVAFVCLVTAIVNWQGKPSRVLLLRLMKDRASHKV
ncbi:hypothetical protein [Pseudoxanthomonas mexicana]